jgi:cytochrome c peroxidase
MYLSLRKLAYLLRGCLQRIAGSAALRRAIVVPVVIAIVAVSAAISEGVKLSNLAPFDDATGVVRTFSTAGSVDLSNAFFQSLGTNGRSCGSCHQPGDAWTVTPVHIQSRFAASRGLDPIFRTNDGADCPSADVSTVAARHQAYSMLLNKGLIRVSIGVPANAEFSITDINDPHNCPDTKASALALFRRPLPSTNLPFLTTVMWDGRESPKGQSLQLDLSHQVVDATLGHAQAAQQPTAEQVAQIVSFETAMFTAQSSDNEAHNLSAREATGGPTPLSKQPFFVGINDVLGADPTGAAFNPTVFTDFKNWLDSTHSGGETNDARASVARGEELFNTLQFTISGVTGLNDIPGVPSALRGTCTVCHDTPNVGNHSVPLAINIGITDYPALPALDTTGLPVYTVQCAPGVAPPLDRPSTFQTTDPARALITGKCADVGKTKGPILRGLAARAPYFHNGSAATLQDVVKFYDQRFDIHLTEQQKADLGSFLRSL